MKRRIIVILTTAILSIGVGLSAANASAGPAASGPSLNTLTPARTASASIPSVCGNEGSGYCLNDWNGYGNGGQVNMYYGGYTNDDFFEYILTNMCNHGHVDAQSSCPFTPGSGLNTDFNGDAIFAIESGITNWCVGTTSSVTVATLTACPNTSGNGGGWGTIWISGYTSSCNGGTNGDNYYENRYWSDTYDEQTSLASGGNIGKQAYVALTGTATCWGYVYT
jgi:hypothetical protein